MEGGQALGVSGGSLYAVYYDDARAVAPHPAVLDPEATSLAWQGLLWVGGGWVGVPVLAACDCQNIA